MSNDVKNDFQMFVCGQCGYIYNPARGNGKGNISPGTYFDDLPDDWICPLCGARKTRFSSML